MAAVAAIALAVWGVGRVQSSADDSSTRAITAGQQMLIAMLDQETGLRGFTITKTEGFLEPYQGGRAKLESALALARQNSRDKRDTRLIEAQVAIARRWQALAEEEIPMVRDGRNAPISDSIERKTVMDSFRLANARYVADKQADRRSDRRAAQIVSILVIVAIGSMFALLGWILFERPARRDASRRRRLAEFGDALQVARSEQEAFAVLKRHLEGWLEQARAVVLVRNSSHNRLEAATTVVDTPKLAEQLESAAPENCLAVRLARPHKREAGDSALLLCELCGELPAASTCVPTTVGGEVVGSVLVQTPARLNGPETDDLNTSVVAAGPVIANLRNLALAERRAATDALTGLANQRAVADNLNRMVAQASRTKAPLTAIMFDLDHFKSVNDIHGHAKGDEVLATISAVVQANMRDSDFVGRYGGEEFIALLPDTALQGGVILAEKLRSAIDSIEIQPLDRGVSASFGVATLPGDAVNGDQLVRAADRALYAAKNAGRNRVEVVGSAERRDEPAERR